MKITEYHYIRIKGRDSAFCFDMRYPPRIVRIVYIPVDIVIVGSYCVCAYVRVREMERARDEELELEPAKKSLFIMCNHFFFGIMTFRSVQWTRQ